MNHLRKKAAVTKHAALIEQGTSREDIEDSLLANEYSAEETKEILEELYPSGTIITPSPGPEQPPKGDKEEEFKASQEQIKVSEVKTAKKLYGEHKVKKTLDRNSGEIKETTGELIRGVMLEPETAQRLNAHASNRGIIYVESTTE